MSGELRASISGITHETGLEGAQRFAAGEGRGGAGTGI